jgi:hypothetical protein
MHAKWARWKDVETEVRFSKRFRNCGYLDGVVESERHGDFALVRYAGPKKEAAPETESVLLLLKAVKDAGWVLGDVGREAFSGTKLRRVSRAVEVRRTYHEGWKAVEGDPPERWELARGGDYVTGMKGWETWDLYSVSEWLDHPLRTQCRSGSRPTVEECLLAVAA